MISWLALLDAGALLKPWIYRIEADMPGDYYHFDPVHHRLAGERTGRSFRLGDTVEVRVMRVDLDERKIDFEMAEKTLSAPIGRKNRGTDAPKAKNAGKAGTKPTEKPVEPAPAARRSAPAKAVKKSSDDTYRPGDAAAKNAELRKSRELKQALLAESKSGGRTSEPGKSGRGAPAKDAGKPSTHTSISRRSALPTATRLSSARAISV